MEYTYEQALKDLKVFMSPIDNSVSDEQRADAYHKLHSCYAHGFSARDAFVTIVNEFYQDRETDEGVRARMRELTTEEKLPATWNTLWGIYLDARETFCPYIAYQLSLSFIDQHSEEIADMMVAEGKARELVEQGMPWQIAHGLAMIAMRIHQEERSNES